jgi:hypothetical protein
MRTTLLELPPVLQLHLVRWTQQNQNWVKLNDKFEYPETIDLSAFLSPDAHQIQSSIYDLYGVLVHTGGAGAGAGHYYSFLRESHGGPWFEFNDAVVMNAVPEKALASNYGGSGFGYDAERAPTAYILFYIRKEDAPLIYREIEESIVPGYVRQESRRPDNRARLGKSEFEVANEECVRRNGACGRPQWQFKRMPKKTVVINKNDTYKKLYQTIAGLYKIPSEKIRLWLTAPPFMPWRVIKEEDHKIELSSDTYMAAQEKPENEPIPLEPDAAVFFITFFHPQSRPDERDAPPPDPNQEGGLPKDTSPSPLQYLGGFVRPRHSRVDNLIPFVAQLLGFPDYTRLEVFDFRNLDSRSKLDDRAEPCRPEDEAVHLIFQFPPDADWPHTTHPWLIASEATGETGPPHLRVVKFGYPRNLPDFLESGIEAIVSLYDSPQEPQVEVIFPSNVSVPAFKRFLADELKHPYDPARQSVAIYKGAPGDNAPPMLPIAEFGRYGLTAEFSQKANAKYSIWVQFLEISEAAYGRSQVFVLAHQTDPGKPGEERRLFLGQKVTVREVLSAFNQNSEGIRVFRVVDHLITSGLAMDTNLYAGDNALLSVKEEVVRPATDERVLRAAHAVIEGTKLKLSLTPFFVRVRLAEKVSAFITRLQREMDVAEEDFRKLKFMLGDQQTRYSTQALIRGDGPMSDALAALRGIADPYLFVIRPPEGRSAAARAIKQTS